MLNIKEYIEINPEILGGQPVFKGTRVAIETLFDHLETGETLNTFLEDFPTVTKEQAVAVIEIVEKNESSDLRQFEEKRLVKGIQKLAEQSKSFSFLKDEEEIYSKNDLKKINEPGSKKEKIIALFNRIRNRNVTALTPEEIQKEVEIVRSKRHNKK